MKQIRAMILILSITFSQSAIGWTGGRLIIDKDTLDLMTQPLIQIFKEKNITAEELWGVELAANIGCFDDGCYLSCFPTWKIEHNKLYLEKITPCCFKTSLIIGCVKY